MERKNLTREMSELFNQTGEALSKCSNRKGVDYCINRYVLLRREMSRSGFSSEELIEQNLKFKRLGWGFYGIPKV